MPPKPHRRWRWRWPWARFLTKKSLAAADEALPFTDDILAEILIRLPTLEDLGRACAACPAFRRVITSHSFLRSLHALRPPSLLGFYSSDSLFFPAEPPHPSAPAARAVAEAADFDFSFLRRGWDCWRVRDGRDGRFLLDCLECMDPTLTRIAVCDPLFRRCKLLPPLPEDLAALARQLFGEVPFPFKMYDVFFAPCSEEEAEGASGAFSVIWVVECPTKLIAFMFSSASGQWRTIASTSRHDLNTMSPDMESTCFVWCRRSYACGCFYWHLGGSRICSKLIVLDMGRMEFYPINYPSNHELVEVAIVELGETRRGMFVISGIPCRNKDRIVRLFSADNQIHDEGATEWVLENTVSLNGSGSFRMLGVSDGKLLLQGAREHNSEEEYGCILLEFKTGLIQRFRGIIHDDCCFNVVQYIGYPPSLSLPTI